MKKRQLCVIITIISILLSVCVPALAQGLIKEINIKDFSYALTDKDEKSATEFTAGGKLTATVTIENNSNDAQNYEFFMLVKNNNKKIDVGEAGTVKGRILRGKSVTKNISFTFPENETDFSGYTVQSFILEDLNYESEMRCIYVDDMEHLYLTNDYIVTHNTTIVLYLIEKLFVLFFHKRIL